MFSYTPPLKKDFEIGGGSKNYNFIYILNFKKKKDYIYI
jgi:hypothetical protein